MCFRTYSCYLIHDTNPAATSYCSLMSTCYTEMNAGTLQDPNGQKFAAGLSTFNRWGEPEDVGDMAAFLASSDSRWVTGQLIDASGGSHL